MQAAQSVGGYETLDEEFARLATELPGGFAGMFFDSTGAMVVALTDVARRDEALERLKRSSRGEKRYSTAVLSSARVQQASFRFDELKRWRERIESQAHLLPGLVMIDIDETTNRITLGFENPAFAQEPLLKTLQSSGIPQIAVTSVAAEKVPTTQTLNDPFSSIPGGVHAYPIIGGTQGGPCTIGINVLYNSNPAFITVSHCTLSMGSLDRGSWGHGGSVILGTEVADRGNRCGPGTTFTPCRASDAAIIGYNGTHPFELGQIARTVWTGYYPHEGSDTIDVATPRLPLVAPGYATSDPVINEWMHRVGRMTGWVAGPVNQTCATYRQTTEWYMLCNFRYYVGTEGGDSGSPVFTNVVCPGEGPFPANCAIFEGIHWGGDLSNSYFSTVRGILSDFAGATFSFVP